MSPPEVQTRRWSRVEYDRLVEHGMFRPDERLELLDGLLVVREPQGSRHATAVGLVHDALAAAFGRRYHVRGPGPIALDESSEPEPDLAVVPGTRRDYRDAHPSSPVLVVEVSDSTLALDRRLKGGLYARAGIAEYWILNLVHRVLEVYRQPVRSSGARHGWKYRSVRLLEGNAVVSPLAAPGARIPVADLLP
jgi:Uma2 family endonuclease